MIVEVTVNEYRGIGIEEFRTDKRRLGYQLTLKGLIKKILSITGITDCNRKSNPTSGEALLGPNPDIDPYRYQTKWSYASIIGMIMYLAFNSLPEIQFSAHQCARFMHN